MERVLSDKANWLSAHGHEVTILTTEQKGRPLAFPLNQSIQLMDLGIGYEENNGSSLWDKLKHYPEKQRRHRKALELALKEVNPDICISMFCNEVNLLPRLKDGSRKVLEVHFSRFKRLQYERGGLWAIADRLRSRQDARLARLYDRFVVLTMQDADFWGKMDTLRVIPNPVHFNSAEPVELDGKTVIAVGRFTHQKGFERLIEAWYAVAPAHPEWKLRLIGDGELRSALEGQIQTLGLSESVTLGQNEKDMESVYSNASILALSSRYEGLPMALIEAQVFGVPAVAFDCKCGPSEIITDGEDGLLVPEGDIQGLAAALTTLMDDEQLRKEMGRKAFKNSFRWKIDSIMPLWIKLFQEIL